ncbi:MAG: asparaginase domain-containing protein [Neisseriaceae bacterium]|nr:asparaginase domain-containing protein [Neisseriaceae bacterium]
MIYTGGTIGMQKGVNGLFPNADSIQCFLNKQQLNERIDLITTQSLIDSSALKISDWNEYIQLINQELESYQGIIVLHGTDTLAYTAAMLSILYSTQKIPIVITGSMLPIFELDSDGKDNIISSIRAIEQLNKGVVVVFNQKMLPAFDCLKISTLDKNAFISPNTQLIANYSKKNTWQFNNKVENFSIHFPKLDCNVFQFCDEIKILNMFLTPTLVEDVSIIGKCQNWDALILQSFGNGNFGLNENIKKLILSFLEKDKPVINVSQVLISRVDDTYALGSEILNTGIISGKCFTFEFCYVLTAVALSCHERNKVQWIQQTLLEIDKTISTSLLKQGGY